MQCRHCGYDLSRTRCKRCPECGGAFDPANAKTWTRNYRQYIIWRRLRPLVISIATIAALPLLYFAVEMLGYWQAEWAYQDIRDHGLDDREAIDDRMLLFWDEEITFEQIPEAWRMGIAPLPADYTIVRYRTAIPIADIHIIYDSDGARFMMIPTYE